MKIEIGKKYKVVKDDNLYLGTGLEFKLIDIIKDKRIKEPIAKILCEDGSERNICLRLFDDIELKENGSIMKIEVGRTYKVKGINRVFKVNRIESYWGGLPNKVIVNVVDDSKMNGEEMTFELKELEEADLEDISTEQFVETEPKASGKPAHYDTAIDPITFAKANLPREEVKGFMKINAIKYITRSGKKGEEVSDLKKCLAYVQMLIEMEEAGE